MPSDAQAPPIASRQRAATAPQEGIDTSTSKRRRWWPVALVVLLVLVGAGWYMRKGKTTDQAAPSGQGAGAGGRRGGAFNGPVPVAVASAVKQDIPVRISALGSVAPLNTVTVRPRVDGQLMEVGFEEGQ